MTTTPHPLEQALWKIYRRPERPAPWTDGGNLPWDAPDFSERMLREHLDQSHGAASRTDAERAIQLDWLWPALGLSAGARVFDVTCGPGLYAVDLARRRCEVVGVDFGPASITYARNLAVTAGVTGRCAFRQADVRTVDYAGEDFDAALLLYGQLAVFKKEEALALLTTIARALRPGGRLCVELLDQNRVDKTDSTWWFTDDTGLWGDSPFLHLGERFWLAEEALSMERFQIVHLETGHLTEINLCDQTYSVAEMTAMMRRAGFSAVTAYPRWDDLPLYDAVEWVVFVAEK